MRYLEGAGKRSEARDEAIKTKERKAWTPSISFANTGTVQADLKCGVLAFRFSLRGGEDAASEIGLYLIRQQACTPYMMAAARVGDQLTMAANGEARGKLDGNLNLEGDDGRRGR